MDDKRGLILKYPVNRPLHPDEIRHHLPVGQPTRAKPWYQLSVIKFNSTYLECIDKFFLQKGYMTGIFSICLLIMVGILVGPIYIGISKYPYPPGELIKYLLAILFISMMSLPMIFLFGSAIKKEVFQYTHYPIRFNRKTRMVHVFRTDGTVLSKPWDDIHFAYCKLSLDTWEVRGLILNAPKNDTVLEVFPLTCHGSIREKEDYVFSQWEFIRCYMEEPDMLQELANQIDCIHNIADDIEDFTQGLLCLEAPFGNLAKLIYPVIYFSAIARAFAMEFGKIPRWPQEVEDESQIEPDDPYIRDPDHLATEEQVQAAYKKYHG